MHIFKKEYEGNHFKFKYLRSRLRAAERERAVPYRDVARQVDATRSTGRKRAEVRSRAETVTE
jgi:hypothetical protein